jgi:hypothetical protein
MMKAPVSRGSAGGGQAQAWLSAARMTAEALGPQGDAEPATFLDLV